MHQTLICGAGKAEITLPLGTPMGGFANRTSTCQGTLDPLFTRALILQAGGSTVLLITLETLAIGASYVQQLVQDAVLASEGSVPAEYVHISCSHTHSSADLSGMFGDEGHIGRYFEVVRAGVRSAVGQAQRSLTPAHLRQGAAEFPIGKNRRLRPGHAQVTALERSQGEQIDHTLTVLRFEALETGHRIATLFHTACHPVCLGPENVQASGDFAGIAAQTIEQQTGAPALFFNGACGNITPIIGKGSSYAATRALGQSVAQAVDAMPLQAFEGESALGASLPSSATLPLSCNFQTEAEISQRAAWFLQQETGFIGWEGVVQDWQRRMQAQLAKGTLPNTLQMPLSAVRIGELEFVFLGAEVFNEYQRWQPANVRLVCYSDAEGCYIPTCAAIDGGGYEVSTAPVFYGLPCGPGPEAEPGLLKAISTVRQAHT